MTSNIAHDINCCLGCKHGLPLITGDHPYVGWHIYNGKPMYKCRYVEELTHPDA